jgi:hypothetical protein
MAEMLIHSRTRLYVELVDIVFVVKIQGCDIKSARITHARSRTVR